MSPNILGTINTALAINADRIIAHSNTRTIDLVPAVSLSSDDQFVRFSNSIVRHNCNNIAISDPMFLSTTTARPQTGSPRHDALPAGSGVGAQDVYRQPRDLGGRTDVGAVEGL